MHIDNDTTPAQLVELLGSAADEGDGRILLRLLSREGVTDTDELTEDDGSASWMKQPASARLRTATARRRQAPRS